MRFGGIHASTVGVRCFPKLGVFRSDTEDQTVRLPGVDGQLFMGGSQAAREFPVHIRAAAANAAAARALLDATATWLTHGQQQLIFDELPDRAWTARLKGPLSWGLGGGSYRTQTDIVMIADDPHAYALTDDTATLSAPGPVARIHGNEASWPTIRINGVLSGSQSVTLNLWGRTVQIQGPLTASERLLIDYQGYTFVVTNAGGAPVRNLAGKMSTLSRIPCPSSGGTVSWTTTGTVTQVTIQCHSRWI